MNRILFSSLTDDWKTPQSVYNQLHEEFNFDFDPCPLHGSGGLEIEWGKSNFVNPPYSEIKEWIKKGYEEYCKGKTVVFLVPSRTDTKWFHDYVLLYAAEIRFIKGRLKFGDSKNSAPFPSCVIIFKRLALKSD